MKRRTLGILAALVLAVVTTTAAHAQNTLATVLGRGTIRVALAPGNPPWAFVDPQGNLQGYDVEIANLLAKALGVTVEWVRTDTAGRVAQLQTHKADVTVATFTPTLDRMKTIAFTDPYAIDGMQVLVPANSPVKDIADFPKGARIATSRGSTLAQAIQKNVPQAQLVELPTNADLVQAIDSGQVDGIAANNGMITETFKTGNGKFRLIPKLMGIEDDAIGLQQGDFPWWLWLNAFVHQINNDGSNYALYTKWFGQEPPPFVHKPPQ